MLLCEGGCFFLVMRHRIQRLTQAQIIFLARAQKPFHLTSAATKTRERSAEKNCVLVFCANLDLELFVERRIFQ